MKKSELKVLIKEEIENIKEESYVDVYSFDKILPKKSRYKFKQAVDAIADVLEDSGVELVSIKQYMRALLEQALKSGSGPIFRDY